MEILYFFLFFYTVHSGGPKSNISFKGKTGIARNSLHRSNVIIPESIESLIIVTYSFDNGLDSCIYIVIKITFHNDNNTNKSTTRLQISTMKLPFNSILAPMLKPYLGRTRMFCHHPTFSMSILYTYMYGVLGFLISANHLRKHLGEWPPYYTPANTEFREDQNFMLLHDLKIIATSMGLVQYACLIVGCLTENPSLFIPHLAGQLLIVTVKILNALLLLAPVNVKAIGRLSHKVPAIMLMTFNWLQEFCVFRQYLCICDL